MNKKSFTNQISYITIPCHWNITVLKKIKKQQDKCLDTKIIEVYGAPISGLVGDGRNTTVTKRFSKSEAIKLRKKIRNLGFSFNYLMNAPIDVSKQDHKELDKYLDWVINKYQADSITLSSLELMKYIRNKYPKIPIYVSTIAGVRNIEDIKKYTDIKPQKIVLHHDAIRDFDNLPSFVSLMKKQGIIIELMLTESCLRNCPKRENHYNTLSDNSSDRKFHKFCNNIKVLKPEEFLRANFIRPEDRKFYENIGFNYFKITGRSKKASWLSEVTEAYLLREYNGNLIRLLGIDPLLNAEKYVYIHNPALKGFIENFPKNTNLENTYCKKWAIKLMQNKEFNIINAKYSDNLKCIIKPKFLEIYEKGEHI